MGRVAQIRARTDAETKKRAEEILEELGLSPSAAINIFYRQIVLRGGLPFNVDIPNWDTKVAIEEERHGEGTIRAVDLEGLLSRILAK